MLLATLSLALAPPLAVQDDARPDVTGVSGAAIHVAPNGHYWTGRSNGQLFRSRDRGASWLPVEVPAEKPDDVGLGGDNLDLVRFLTADVGLIGGSFEGEYGLLVTADGGATWEPRAIPSSMLTYGSWSLANGTAWLFGHTGEIFRSDDLASTWAPLPSPFTSVIRPFDVHFASREHGVGGGSHNRIYVTADGGASWSAVPTPVDGFTPPEELQEPSGASTVVTRPDGSIDFEPVPPGPDTSVDRVRRWGAGLVVRQEKVYFTPSVDPPAWRALHVGDSPVQDFELHPNGLAVLAADGTVALLRPDLVQAWRSTERLPFRAEYTGGISVDGADVVVHDGRTRMMRVGSGGEATITRLRQAADGAQWTIQAFDLSMSDVLWGLTESSLCRSEDFGRSWRRVAGFPVPARYAVEASGTDGAFLWSSSFAFRWSAETRGFEEVAFADRTHAVRIHGIVKREGVWLAHGLRYAAADEPEVGALMTMMHTVAEHDAIEGIVLASTNQGASWSLVHRWPGGSIEAFDLGEGGIVRLYRAGGGVAVGQMHTSPPRLEAAVAVQPSDPLITLEYGVDFAFVNEREGELRGGRFYGDEDEQHYRTFDGGRNWTAFTGDDDWHHSTFHRLGSGVRVRVQVDPQWDFRPPPEHPDVVELVDEHPGRWELGRIRLHRIDARGRLLVERENGELRVLDEHGRDWTVLREAR